MLRICFRRHTCIRMFTKVSNMVFFNRRLKRCLVLCSVASVLLLSVLVFWHSSTTVHYSPTPIIRRLYQQLPNRDPPSRIGQQSGQLTSSRTNSFTPDSQSLAAEKLSSSRTNALAAEKLSKQQPEHLSSSRTAEKLSGQQSKQLANSGTHALTPDGQSLADEKLSGQQSGQLASLGKNALPSDGHPLAAEKPIVDKLKLKGESDRCSSGQPTNIVFIKTHKSGSTTVANILARYALSYNLNIALPNRVPNGVQFNYFKGLRAESVMPLPPGETYNVLFNHMISNRTQLEQLMPNNSFYCAIIREPYSRLLSSLNYYKHRVPEDMWKYLMDTQVVQDRNSSVKVNSSLTRQLSEQEKHSINNTTLWTNSTLNLRTLMNSKAQSRMRRPEVHNSFAGDSGLKFSDQQNLAAVKHHLDSLDKQMDLVLVLERFHESLVLFRRKACLRTEDMVFLPLNAAKGNKITRLLPDDKAFTEEWEMAEHILYRHFAAKFDKQVAEQGDDFHEEVETFKKQLEVVKEFCSPWRKVKFTNMTSLARLVANDVFRTTRQDNILRDKLLAAQWGPELAHVVDLEQVAVSSEEDAQLRDKLLATHWDPELARVEQVAVRSEDNARTHLKQTGVSENGEKFKTKEKEKEGENVKTREGKNKVEEEEKEDGVSADYAQGTESGNDKFDDVAADRNFTAQVNNTKTKTLVSTRNVVSNSKPNATLNNLANSKSELTPSKQNANLYTLGNSQSKLTPSDLNATLSRLRNSTVSTKLTRAMLASALRGSLLTHPMPERVLVVRATAWGEGFVVKPTDCMLMSLHETYLQTMLILRLFKKNVNAVGEFDVDLD